MLALLSSLFSGGLIGSSIGLLGSYLTKVEDRKNLEMTLQHQIRMKELDAQIAQDKQLKDLEIANVDAKGKVEVEEVKAFDTSQRVGNKTIGSRWIDGFRSLMRPLITIYFLVMMTLLSYQLYSIDQVEMLDYYQLGELFTVIVFQLSSLTSMSVSWWFGSRTGIKGISTKVQDTNIF